MADAPDPSSALEGIEPETVDGPLGLPVVKPKALPDPPGTGGDAPDILPGN